MTLVSGKMLRTCPSTFGCAKDFLLPRCSRPDAYFGDASKFNASVFNETRSYWKTPLITLQQAAESRLARVRTSNATNPKFELSELGENFSVGEVAGYILFLGDKTNGTVPRDWVEYLFGTSSIVMLALTMADMLHREGAPAYGTWLDEERGDGHVPGLADHDG